MSGSGARGGDGQATGERWLGAKRWLRDVALLAFAAMAAYLLTTIAIARLAAVVAAQVHRTAAPWYLALLIAALVDGAKLIGLLPAAWIVRRAISIGPVAAASILVLGCFGLEVGVMGILQQAAWSWQRPGVWVVRLVVLLLSIVLVAWVMRRGKRGSPPATS